MSESGSHRLRKIEPTDDATPAATAKTPALKRTVSGTEQWSAWTGTISDLAKVAALFDEIASEHGLSTETTLTTIDEATVSGAFPDVSPEIDPQTWASIDLEAGQSWEDNYLVIRLRRKPGAFGAWVAALSVKSTDPGMAAGSRSRLRARISLGKPGWRWVHTAVGAAVVTWITTLIIAWGGSLLLVSRLTVELWGTTFFVFLISLSVLCVAFQLISHPVITRALPPCELRHDAQPQSRGTKFIGGLLAVWIIPIIITVVANILT